MKPAASSRSRSVAAVAAVGVVVAALILGWRGSVTRLQDQEISVWEPVGSWSGGGGNTQTDSFLGETGILRITWDARGRSTGAGSLKITLYSAISGRPLSVAVDQHGPGGGTTFLNEDPRTFFFVVEASDLDWSLKAEEEVGITHKTIEGRGR